MDTDDTGYGSSNHLLDNAADNTRLSKSVPLDLSDSASDGVLESSDRVGDVRSRSGNELDPRTAMNVDQLAIRQDQEASTNIATNTRTVSETCLDSDTHRRECNRTELGQEVICDCDMCLLGFDDTQPDGDSTVNIRKKSVSQSVCGCVCVCRVGQINNNVLFELRAVYVFVVISLSLTCFH